MFSATWGFSLAVPIDERPWTWFHGQKTDNDTSSRAGLVVMELLEGETLRARLDAGSISRKQAVDYAIQAAVFRAYLLKEDFLAAYSYAHPSWARLRMRRWIRWAIRSRLRPFRRVASTVQLYLDGILNFVRYRLTNGPLEGMNNKIRLISHRAYGFKAAQTLAAMIFLCCTFPLPLPQIA